jgi:hypothetical protein
MVRSSTPHLASPEPVARIIAEMLRRSLESAGSTPFRRVLRHRGPKKAVVAVAHALLRMVYHVLADGTVYREAGADYYDRHHSQRVTRRALQALERQGYRVTLEPAA